MPGYSTTPFSYTGSLETYTVPDSVHCLTIRSGDRHAIISRCEIVGVPRGKREARTEARRAARLLLLHLSYLCVVYGASVRGSWRVGSRVSACRFVLRPSVVCTQKCGSPGKREKATKRPQNHLMTTKNTTVAERDQQLTRVFIIYITAHACDTDSEKRNLHNNNRPAVDNGIPSASRFWYAILLCLSVIATMKSYCQNARALQHSTQALRTARCAIKSY